jgi:uncharacterized protein (TIGR02569 family)
VPTESVARSVPQDVRMNESRDGLPSTEVLAAFGVAGEPVPLAGGQGRSVRVGGCVLKPLDGSAAAAEWAVTLWERLPPGATEFRVPKPLRAADGRCVVRGWTASEFLPGEPGPRGRWEEVAVVGRALHAALRSVPRPTFLDGRTHPWAVADRVAWGEQEVRVAPALAEPYERARALVRPVRLPSQLVHGDLAGNVLFAPGGLPTVIDFSPYWRPTLYAEAVVAVDGLLWSDLPPARLAAWHEGPCWQGMLARALIFRLVAQSELAPTAMEGERYGRAVAALEGGVVGGG